MTWKTLFHICGIFQIRNIEESKECQTRHTELSQGLAVRRKSVSDTDLEGVQSLVLVSCYPEIVHLPGALNSAPHDHSMWVTLTCRKTCALCPCGHRENALPTLLSPYLPVLLSDSLHYYILAASEAAPHRAKGPSGKRGASVWSQNWKSRTWGEG